MAHSIDYDKLDSSLQKRYKFADVKHRLVKVCFDVVRFKDSDPEELWQIQTDLDGDYIVAKYEIDAPTTAETTTKTASKSHWDVSVNEKTNQLNIFYKDYQVAKLAATSLGIHTEDLANVKRYLPARLSEDKTLVKALLNTLSSTDRYQFCRQFPELNKA